MNSFAGSPKVSCESLPAGSLSYLLLVLLMGRAAAGCHFPRDKWLIKTHMVSTIAGVCVASGQWHVRVLLQDGGLLIMFYIFLLCVLCQMN